MGEQVDGLKVYGAGTYPSDVQIERRVVELVPVSDVVLDDLVSAATTQADADEVTPPLTPGGGWSPERVAWLRTFHLDRRPGLDGPAGEITWAVQVDGRVVGSVRLRRTSRPGAVEIGLWLTRDVRGQGVGTAVLAAVVQRATELGTTELRADTTALNEGAIRLLRRHHFTLDRSGGGTVHAVRPLHREPTG